MNKYIQDFIRNNSREIFKGMTIPQKKAINEILRGLFTAKTPVLRHLAQHSKKTAKKQGEKYSHHLGHVSLKEDIEEFALKKVKQDIKKNTIIAYDLSDINKERARKMDKISRVFDGSKRRITNGFILHGLGVNTIPLKLEVHDGEVNTTNQIRRRTVEKYSKTFKRKGIWVFDRGNDDKAFFKDLRHNFKVQFITRLKSNRQVVVRKTGVIIKVAELPPGRYQVYLMNKYNTKVDLRYKYTLIIKNIEKNLKRKQPIRLLCYLKDSFSINQIINFYLERWGIENSFKRAKQKFNLEKIRVLNHQKFVNLVSIIQLAVILSIIMFLQIQGTTLSVIFGVLISYKKFLQLKNLSFNLDSYISFLQFTLKPIQFHSQKDPPKQPSLFSERVLRKVGSF